LCYVAYAILAFNHELLGNLRDDTNVPFLMVADYSSVFAEQSVSTNNAMLAYVKKIHSACHMPNGTHAAGFLPKKPQEYEAYLQKPQYNKKVTLIEHREKVLATANIRHGFPMFYSIIDEEYEFGKKFFPYSSLPFIVATNSDEFPENYFLTFDTDEIGGSDEADVMEAMTRIVQSACIGLTQKNIIPNMLKSYLLDALQICNPNRPLSSDATNKHEANIRYLTEILLVTAYVLFWTSSTINTQDDVDRVSRLLGNITDAVQDKHHASSSSCDLFTGEEHSAKSPVTQLLRCIAEDLERGDVFDQDNPKTIEAYVAVKFAFLYNGMICFKRESEEKAVADTLVKYLRKHDLIKVATKLGIIWDELSKEPYQDLTYRTNNKYYKYTITRNVHTANVYAFNISALKEYIAKARNEEQT
jgi:hypothetical protein